MNQAKIIGKLMPSHPDLFPIIQYIRDKYNIPEIGPEDDGFSEILINDLEYNWEEIKSDISIQVRGTSVLLPNNLRNLYNKFGTRTEDGFSVPGLNLLPKQSRDDIESILEFIYNLLVPVMEKVSMFYNTLTLLIFEYLITGEAREIPYDWFGDVQNIQFMGEPAVFILAGQFSDPKVLSDKFRFEFTKQFGKDRPKFSEGNLNAAEYLAMKMQGKPIRDIADSYILRHPSQFPKDTQSTEYREAKRKCEEMLKKRMQRLQDDFYKLLGDKN